jgi:UDP-N-acetylmuramoyl-L-alanyl-D-glutamate--2,6-diaminopimelate ligase
MKFNTLIQNINVISITDFPENKEITDITNNSREVKSGAMFVAIKGFSVDGHKYIEDAINNGASAVVMQEGNKFPDELFNVNDVIRVVVKNSRETFADLSCQFYGHPSKELTLVGITGSNGKTTTAFYIKNLFETAGYKTGLLGTISNYVGNFEENSKLTTPESNVINKYLRQMLDEGITHCVMEVSSHSLVLDRVRGLDFDYAVFTNITSDHLDFHHDFENYLQAKKILFDNLNENAIAVINIDDKSSEKIVADSKAKKILFGKKNNADFIIENVSYNLEGTLFDLRTAEFTYSFSTSLIGEFNAYNASAAAVIGFSEGYEEDIVIQGINSTPQVPGRFEIIGENNKKVIVDYSHTADSLKKALIALNKIVEEKQPIYTVFGCGGNRDKTKRPVMGKIADKLSNKIIITSDNPRFENPAEIINEILTGVERENPIVIENREEAIKTAICNSEDNAVILIAGKGHEDYQIINGVKHHFSDKEIAEKYLASCV